MGARALLILTPAIALLALAGADDAQARAGGGQGYSGGGSGGSSSLGSSGSYSSRDSYSSSSGSTRSYRSHKLPPDVQERMEQVLLLFVVTVLLVLAFGKKPSSIGFVRGWMRSSRSSFRMRATRVADVVLSPASAARRRSTLTCGATRSPAWGSEPSSYWVVDRLVGRGDRALFAFVLDGGD